VLSDREKKVARQVRRSLHLSASMSEREVARHFQGSMAWRRARLGLAGEELREGITGTLWPAVSRLQTYMRSLIHRIDEVWKELRS